MTESFADFPLHPDIIKSLDEIQFTKPSTIQQLAIPPILERKDVIGLAKTGTGKTAACAVPVCHLMDIGSLSIQALIVVPTRELALQYAQEVQRIGKRRGIKAFALCGGEDYSLQLSKLKAGVQVLVATPGRLIDFVYSRSIDLSHVKILILDEADEMLSMGFVDDLEFIFQCLIQEHQTLLFSATMPSSIRNLALKYLKDPVQIGLVANDEIPSKISHRFFFCNHTDRDKHLLHQITAEHPEQAIVFCPSRIRVEKTASFLSKALPGKVDLLHAGLPQDIRNIVTGKFRQKKVKILVATDVVARGLDFSSVSHVFILELSPDLDIYVHRAGRTGRFGKEGKALTFVTGRELETARRLQKKLGDSFQWVAPPPAHPAPRPRHR
jgi:ATP-dependent RNA helicase DeaD